MIPHGVLVLYAAFLLLCAGRLLPRGAASGSADWSPTAILSIIVTGLAGYGLVQTLTVAPAAPGATAAAILALAAACAATWLGLRRFARRSADAPAAATSRSAGRASGRKAA